MLISDLNYLETVSQSTSVTGGLTESDIVRNLTNSRADIRGNVALSFGDAAAFGDDTFTKTITSARVVDDQYSISSSTSVAATGEGA